LSEYRMGMLVGTTGLPGALSLLRQFIATTSLRTLNFIPRALHMRSVVDNMALGHVLAKILRFFLLGIISQIFYTTFYSSATDTT